MNELFKLQCRLWFDWMSSRPSGAALMRGDSVPLGGVSGPCGNLHLACSIAFVEVTIL
jgi:hypothetical protein